MARQITTANAIHFMMTKNGSWCVTNPQAAAMTADVAIKTRMRTSISNGKNGQAFCLRFLEFDPSRFPLRRRTRLRGSDVHTGQPLVGAVFAVSVTVATEWTHITAHFISFSTG